MLHKSTRISCQVGWFSFCETWESSNFDPELYKHGTDKRDVNLPTILVYLIQSSNDFNTISHGWCLDFYIWVYYKLNNDNKIVWDMKRQPNQTRVSLSVHPVQKKAINWNKKNKTLKLKSDISKINQSHIAHQKKNNRNQI